MRAHTRNTRRQTVQACDKENNTSSKRRCRPRGGAHTFGFLALTPQACSQCHRRPVSCWQQLTKSREPPWKPVHFPRDAVLPSSACDCGARFQRLRKPTDPSHISAWPSGWRPWAGRLHAAPPQKQPRATFSNLLNKIFL